MDKFSKFCEAMDLSGGGKYFHPSKKKLIQQPSDDVKELTELYPQFDTPEVQSYLELITSESYNDTVNKLSRYLGINEDELYRKYPNFSSLYGLVIEVLYDIINLESSQKQQLEQLAVDLVLDLPEFAKIKEMVESGELQINASLSQPDVSGFTNEIQDENQESPQPGELTDDELKTEDIFEDLTKSGDPLTFARRALARTFTQGAAVNKFYLFHLAQEKLGNELINKYGIFSAIASLGYYGMPLMDLSNVDISDALIGKADTESGDESDTINATGIVFPALVHELVKGIYNYLSYDIASQEQLDKEDINRETLEMMSGPRLAKNIQSLIDTKDQYLMPYILKLLIRLPKDQIKQILIGGNTGKRVVNQLVQQAKDIESDQ